MLLKNKHVRHYRNYRRIFTWSNCGSNNWETVVDRKAGIGVIAGNTVWSMLERLECEVLQKARYINTLMFTFTIKLNAPYLPNAKGYEL